MKRIFVGHRGVGKTSLLLRHLQYFPNVPHFDLDVEIEKKIHVSIEAYFSQYGEDSFRKIEFEVYCEISNNHSQYVIALGAGFPVHKLSSQVEVIFVSRVTDADGRIFLNRPRLNKNVSTLEEYNLRFIQRDSAFRERADFIYHLPEGLEQPTKQEQTIFEFKFKIKNHYYTLMPEELTALKQRMQNFAKVELRTDLLSEAQIQSILQKNPGHHWLVSHRTEKFFASPGAAEVDCDVRFYKNQSVQIISNHTDSIDQGLLEINSFADKLHVKLCPLIENFDELKKGYEWQQANPSKRSFLPRSRKGMWNWFRFLTSYTQKINFVRNLTELADQPSLFQCLALPETRPKQWAAVVGSPIHFSRSPAQHAEFFRKFQSYLCAIQIGADDFKEQIGWLHELGLNFLAVTSPLKETAYEICDEVTDTAQEIKSVNTIHYRGKKMIGHNTDMDGFRQLEIPNSEEVAVWGGGGTLQMMKKVLPKAIFFSSQSGHPREGEMPSNSFSTIVWAAPRISQESLAPLDWPLKQIIDLNYTENSAGLEFAQRLLSSGKKVNYVSGLMMFEEQARQQQEFWSTT